MKSTAGGGADQTTTGEKQFDVIKKESAAICTAGGVKLLHREIGVEDRTEEAMKRKLSSFTKNHRRNCGAKKYRKLTEGKREERKVIGYSPTPKKRADLLEDGGDRERCVEK